MMDRAIKLGERLKCTEVGRRGDRGHTSFFFLLPRSSRTEYSAPQSVRIRVDFGTSIIIEDDGPGISRPTNGRVC